MFSPLTNKMFYKSIWLFKNNRWTDVWMFTKDSMIFSNQIVWLFKAYRWTDVQTLSPKILWDFPLRSHDCLKLKDGLLKAYNWSKPPDEQMFRCFQHWLIRCFSQSIWLFKTSRWTDVWMFTNDSMRFSTQIALLFKTYRWADV